MVTPSLNVVALHYIAIGFKLATSNDLKIMIIPNSTWRQTTVHRSILVVHIIIPNSESIHQQQITNHAGHTAAETNSLSSEVLVVVFIATHSDGS